MKKEIKLVNKVKRLLKRLEFPKWLHHFGPKTYKFYEHLVALLARFYCRLSYRRTAYFLDLFGVRCPSKSALQYTMQKIKTGLWQRILEETSGGSHYLVALDSTGFSRTNPSYHYLKRINSQIPKMYAKLSATFDVKKRKFCAARIRVLPAHDIKDAKSLILKSNPKIVVADKAYDSNWLHKSCVENNVKAHIPIRQYGNSIHSMWSIRRLAVNSFDETLYHQRELIEAGFGSVKRKYGGSVNSKKAKTIKAEIYGRLICHNFLLFLLDF